MRDDYILRMIEVFGQFAIALRKLLLGGRASASEVRQALRSVAQDAGFDLDMLRVVSVDTLIFTLSPGGELDPTRCWMCAETLYLDALDAELSGDAHRARDGYHKARVLYSMVAPLGAFLVGFPEAAVPIDEIDERLSDLADPTDDDRPERTVHRRPRRRGVGRRAGPGLRSHAAGPSTGGG